MVGGFERKERVEEDGDWINECAGFGVGLEAEEEKRLLMKVKRDAFLAATFFFKSWLQWRWWWWWWEEKMKQPRWKRRMKKEWKWEKNGRRVTIFVGGRKEEGSKE